MQAHECARHAQSHASAGSGTLRTLAAPPARRAARSPRRPHRRPPPQGAEYLCGDASLKALQARIGSSPVRCNVRSKDQYGRNVASCSILSPGGAEDMGAWLVGNGYAVAYRKISQEYAPLEDKARAAKIGIWSGSFTMPAKWRYEHKAASMDEVRAARARRGGGRDAPRGEGRAADAATRGRCQSGQAAPRGDDGTGAGVCLGSD